MDGTTLPLKVITPTIVVQNQHDNCLNLATHCLNLSSQPRKARLRLELGECYLIRTNYD